LAKKHLDINMRAL